MPYLSEIIGLHSLCILQVLLSGSFLDQKSTSFKEEFPQLGDGRSFLSRENADGKVTQYGPSLRPQSMCLVSYVYYGCKNSSFFKKKFVGF